MNIYCPHCGKKNSLGIKQCAGCDGNLNSLGSVPVKQQVFTPAIIQTRDDNSNSIPATTKSSWLAKREARRTKEQLPPEDGEPAMPTERDDGDEGVSVQYFDSSKFSGELLFSSESTKEDAQTERISIQMPPRQSEPIQAKRGRKPGSKNKK